MIKRGAIGRVEPERCSVGYDRIGTPGWIDEDDMDGAADEIGRRDGTRSTH
jgi:hypothetical protein